jgi:hypothetical protein
MDKFRCIPGSEYGLQAKISEAETSRLKAQQPSDRLRSLAPPNFGRASES